MPVLQTKPEVEFYADRVSKRGARRFARSLIATRLEIQAINDEEARYQHGPATVDSM
jgi:hypothetical protein